MDTKLVLVYTGKIQVFDNKKVQFKMNKKRTKLKSSNLINLIGIYGKKFAIKMCSNESEPKKTRMAH